MYTISLSVDPEGKLHDVTGAPSYAWQAGKVVDPETLPKEAQQALAVLKLVQVEVRDRVFGVSVPGAGKAYRWNDGLYSYEIRLDEE